MQDIWQRIEIWLGAHAPEILNALLPGASDDAVRSAEAQMNVRLTSDFKASCALHDGQSFMASPLMGEWYLLPLQNIVDSWRLLKELLDAGRFTQAETEVKTSGPVRANWWRPEWIPVAYNGAGDFYCLDLKPESGGQAGQVISYWHVDVKREKLADSFHELLERFASDLEAGKYRVESGELIFQD